MESDSEGPSTLPLPTKMSMCPSSENLVEEHDYDGIVKRVYTREKHMFPIL